MPSPHVVIRPARPDDASALDGVLRSLGWFDELDAIPAQETTAQIQAQVAALGSGQNTLLVAESAEGQVAGYVMAHWFPNLLVGGEGYVSELFLRPEARGRGIGTALLEEVKREARERGCERLILFNRKMRESYQRCFYQRRGWVERDDTALMMFYLNEQA